MFYTYIYRNIKKESYFNICAKVTCISPQNFGNFFVETLCFKPNSSFHVQNVLLITLANLAFIKPCVKKKGNSVPQHTYGGTGGRGS
jgi:hypothetical protein